MLLVNHRELYPIKWSMEKGVIDHYHKDLRTGTYHHLQISKEPQANE